MYTHRMLNDSIISAQNNNHISTTLRGAQQAASSQISTWPKLMAASPPHSPYCGVSAVLWNTSHKHTDTHTPMHILAHILSYPCRAVSVGGRGWWWRTMTCMVYATAIGISPVSLLRGCCCKSSGKVRRDYIQPAYGTRLLHCRVCMSSACVAPNSLEPLPPLLIRPRWRYGVSSLNYYTWVYFLRVRASKRVSLTIFGTRARLPASFYVSMCVHILFVRRSLCHPLSLSLPLSVSFSIYAQLLELLVLHVYPFGRACIAVEHMYTFNNVRVYNVCVLSLLLRLLSAASAAAAMFAFAP